MQADDNTGDNITGGYILKVDKITGLTSDEYFRTYPDVASNFRNYSFTYEYPDWDEITAQQKSYLRSYIQTIESTLYGSSFNDPDEGFRKYMSELSFIDYQISQELANNVDGYRYSTFFYKKRASDGGKLFAGPFWDFDLCYGNVDYASRNLATSGWLYTSAKNEYARVQWWYRMMDDETYRDRFILRWRDLREGPLNTDSLMIFIDKSVLQLGDAVTRNFERWPVLNKYVWPNSFIGTTYTQEIDFLKRWLTSRLQWIDENIHLASKPAVNYAHQFVVYPNPLNTEMNLKFYLSSPERAEIVLSDMLGKKVFLYEYLTRYTGNQILRIQIPETFSGYYILHLRQDNTVIYSQKVLIINNTGFNY